MTFPLLYSDLNGLKFLYAKDEDTTFDIELDPLSLQPKSIVKTQNTFEIANVLYKMLMANPRVMFKRKRSKLNNERIEAFISKYGENYTRQD